MNAKQFTLTLLFALVALIVASWGRFLEWWNNLSPEWKTGLFVFAWAMLILIGYRQGQIWMFAGIMSGFLFGIGVMVYAIRRIIKDFEEMP